LRPSRKILLISTEVVGDNQDNPGEEHPVGDNPVVEHQGSLAEGEEPPLADILVEEQHLVGIPAEELHREVGSNPAEDKQVAVQGTQAVLGGCHTHKGCNLQAWVCKVGKAWACHQVQQDKGGDLVLLHKGWELQLAVVQEQQGQYCQYLTHWEVVDVQVDHSCEVVVQGRDELGLQGEGPATYWTGRRRDPSIAPLSLSFWRSRNRTPYSGK